MTEVDQPEPDASDVNDIEVRAIAAERLTFFVDAVIAIALTLLALDLTPPGGATNAEFFHSLAEHNEEYQAFLISFLVIAGHWASHHRIFRYVTHLDGRLTMLTLLWLLMQVTTPFATRIITEGGAIQARFGLYAVVQIIADLLFMLMLREIQTHHMYRGDTPPNLFRNTYLRLAALAGGFAISIPLSFVTPYAYLIWIAVPVAMNWTHRVAGLREHRSTT